MACGCSQTRIVVSCMMTFVLNSFFLQITDPLKCVSYLLSAFGRLQNQVSDSSRPLTCKRSGSQPTDRVNPVAANSGRHGIDDGVLPHAKAG